MISEYGTTQHMENWLDNINVYVVKMIVKEKAKRKNQWETNRISMSWFVGKNAGCNY